MSVEDLKAKLERGERLTDSDIKLISQLTEGSRNGGLGVSISDDGRANLSRQTGYSPAADAITNRAARLALNTTGLRNIPGAVGVGAGILGGIASGKDSNQVTRDATSGILTSAAKAGLDALGVAGGYSGPALSMLGAGLSSTGTDTQRGRASMEAGIGSLGGLGGMIAGSLLGPIGMFAGGMLGSDFTRDSFRSGLFGDAFDARENEVFRDTLERTKGYYGGKDAYASTMAHAKHMDDGERRAYINQQTLEADPSRTLADIATNDKASEESGFLSAIGSAFSSFGDWIGSALGLDEETINYGALWNGVDGAPDGIGKKDIYEGHNDFLGGRDSYWSGGDGQGGHGPDGSDVRASHDRDNDGGHGADGR